MNKILIKKNKKEDTYPKISIEIAQNGKIKYERSSWIMRVLRIPVVFFLNLLPSKLSGWLLQTFSSARGGSADVKKWPTTYKALEVMYTYPDRRARGETSIFEYFWFYILKNPQALRNRLLLTAQELTSAIKETAKRKPEVCLMSLGSGSARAVMMALVGLNHRIKTRVRLIDISRDALHYSRTLAEKMSVDVQIDFFRGDLWNVEKFCDENFQPDIIEMVGLLDYLPQEKAIKTIRKIYRVLTLGGWLITCNIQPNFERPFLTKGVGWPMIYRTPQETAKIVIEGGFSPFGLRVVCEPLKIHGLVIAQKL